MNDGGGLENHNRFCKGEHVAPPVVTASDDDDYSITSNIKFFMASFNDILHLLVATVIAWMLGYFGFSFIWIVLLFFQIYRLDTRIRLKKWHKQFIEWREQEKQVSVYFLTVLILKEPVRYDSTESAAWFNLLADKWWPCLSPIIDDLVKNLIFNTLNNKEVRPNSVDEFLEPTVRFGTIAPTFSRVTGIRLVEDTVFVLIFDVSNR